MAALKVEITSKDMIRPSSPTPSHQKTLQLSFLDQFATPVHMPFIFYYQKCGQNPIKLLKKSLSDTLVQFYPLAGRLQGNASIDCNDEGVIFYEADVSANFSKLIHNNPNPDELLSLLPISPFTANHDTILAGVQVNRFRCGGMAISVSISHKIVDAATFLTFVTAWATTARTGRAPVADAKFDSILVFPPNVDFSGIAEAVGVCKEKIVTRRLIFDKDKVDALKNRAKVANVLDPTRVEVVSAFVWERFIRAALARPRPPKIVSASQIVNLRKVVGKKCHGNIFWSIFAHEDISSHDLISSNTNYPYPGVLVDKLRTAVNHVDKNYLGKIQRGECRRKSEGSIQEEQESYNFSSCTRFPLYEVNFGWGTPIWVSMTPLPFKNTIILLGTKCGQGVEAWVNLLQHDVAAFEQDHEFHALIIPSHNIVRPKL